MAVGRPSESVVDGSVETALLPPPNGAHLCVPSALGEMPSCQVVWFDCAKNMT